MLALEAALAGLDRQVMEPNPKPDIWLTSCGASAQVLALEAALAGLDRQIMEQLMTRQASDASPTQPTLEKKARLWASCACRTTFPMAQHTHHRLHVSHALAFPPRVSPCGLFHMLCIPRRSMDSTPRCVPDRQHVVLVWLESPAPRFVGGAVA